MVDIKYLMSDHKLLEIHGDAKVGDRLWFEDAREPYYKPRDRYVIVKKIEKNGDIIIDNYLIFDSNGVYKYKEKLRLYKEKPTYKYIQVFYNGMFCREYNPEWIKKYGAEDVRDGEQE